MKKNLSIKNIAKSRLIYLFAVVILSFAYGCKKEEQTKPKSEGVTKSQQKSKGAKVSSIVTTGTITNNGNSIVITPTQTDPYFLFNANLNTYTVSWATQACSNATYTWEVMGGWNYSNLVTSSNGTASFNFNNYWSGGRIELQVTIDTDCDHITREVIITVEPD